MPAGRTSKYGLPLPLAMTTILLLFIFFVLSSPVSAEPRNVTIDDQGGDPETKEVPVYLPSIAWANELCGGCAIHPNVDQLYNHTAMAATFMPEKNITNNTIDFHFSGTAVYIFFTLFSNEGDGVTVNTECNFTIDGEYAGFFKHSADPSQSPGEGRQYGVPVFSKTGLAQAQHSMTIYMANVDYHVFLSFDYAIYTTELNSSASSSAPIFRNTVTSLKSRSTSTPSTSNVSSSVSPGIIVGGVLGGIAVLAGFIILIYFYRKDSRRYRRPSSPEPHVPRPFIDVPTSLEAGSQGHSSRRHRPTHPSITSFPYSQSPSSGSSGPGSGSGSGSGTDRTVEHRIRAANQRMHSLRVEMASVSERAGAASSNGSGSSSARMMAELAEEVKKLRRELQVLKQLQGQQAQAQVQQAQAQVQQVQAQVQQAQRPPSGLEEPPPIYHLDDSRQ